MAPNASRDHVHGGRGNRRGHAATSTAVELTGVGPAPRVLQDLVGSDLLLLAVTLAVIFAIAALLLQSAAGLVVVGTIATSYIYCA